MNGVLSRKNEFNVDIPNLLNAFLLCTLTVLADIQYFLAITAGRTPFNKSVIITLSFGVSKFTSPHSTKSPAFPSRPSNSFIDEICSFLEIKVSIPNALISLNVGILITSKEMMTRGGEAKYINEFNI